MSEEAEYGEEEGKRLIKSDKLKWEQHPESSSESEDSNRTSTILESEEGEESKSEKYFKRMNKNSRCSDESEHVSSSKRGRLELPGFKKGLS